VNRVEDGQTDLIVSVTRRGRVTNFRVSGINNLRSIEKFIIAANLLEAMGEPIANAPLGLVNAIQLIIRESKRVYLQLPPDIDAPRGGG